MGGRKRRPVPADMSRAAERFTMWRSTQVRGTRIPDRLWDTAVALAGKYGLSRTAAAVKVGYYALKERCEAGPRASPDAQASTATPTFVELPPAPFTVPGECVIELENTSGVTLRVRLQGHAVPDLVALCRSFWGAS